MGGVREETILAQWACALSDRRAHVSHSGFLALKRVKCGLVALLAPSEQSTVGTGQDLLAAHRSTGEESET